MSSSTGFSSATTILALWGEPCANEDSVNLWTRRQRPDLAGENGVLMQSSPMDAGLSAGLPGPCST